MVKCPWNAGMKLQGILLHCPQGLGRCKIQVFLWIDVDSDGSTNDASVYNRSKLKEGLENPKNIFNIPEKKSLPGDDVPIPYCIVGDNAFGIHKSLMNPFSIRNMEHHKKNI